MGKVIAKPASAGKFITISQSDYAKSKEKACCYKSTQEAPEGIPFVLTNRKFLYIKNKKTTQQYRKFNPKTMVVAPRFRKARAAKSKSVKA